MSLSSLLETDLELRAYLRGLAAQPRLPRPAPGLVAPPRSSNPGLVGTAFDYLLRWHLQRANPRAHTRAWVARAAVERLPPHLRSRGDDLVQRAEENHGRFLNGGEFSDELCEVALGLARLDTVFRTGKGADEIRTPASREDIEDLRVLVAASSSGMVRRYERCVLNPAFGQGSAAVGGADADLILDDVLVEIKTTKTFRLERMAFDQLLGYVLLAWWGGVNGDAQMGRTLKQVGIYFARYGTLVAWPLDSLLTEAALHRAVAWFRNHVTSSRPS
ncbi:MAG TPA: hypothetical protein VNJ71_01460 [Gemmatimonadales bacterium]|nr:hypothetical protein [Gemmatimonadales bacterium]